MCLPPECWSEILILLHYIQYIRHSIFSITRKAGAARKMSSPCPISRDENIFISNCFCCTKLIHCRYRQMRRGISKAASRFPGMTVSSSLPKGYSSRKILTASRRGWGKIRHHPIPFLGFVLHQGRYRHRRTLSPQCHMVSRQIACGVRRLERAVPRLPVVAGQL